MSSNLSACQSVADAVIRQVDALSPYQETRDSHSCGSGMQAVRLPTSLGSRRQSHLAGCPGTSRYCPTCCEYLGTQVDKGGELVIMSGFITFTIP